MSSRDHIGIKTKLAAAICEMLAIPHEHAQIMTADQVLSLVNWDHFPIRRDDGLKLGMSVAEVDHHSNIVPKTIMAHREKTAGIDQPQIAKTKRTHIALAKHAAVMAAKAGQVDELAAALAPLADKSRARPKRKIPSRGFPKGHRPLRSRNTFERRAR